MFRRLKYRAAIFDFDGTLADSGLWFLRVINELAVEFGFRPIRPEDHEKIRSYSAGEVIKLLGLPLWKMPRVMIATRQRAARDWETIELFPGVTTMLRDLRKGGLTLAVVSSNSEETIRKVLHAKNAPAMDHFACGASLFGKAVKLRRMLKQAGLTARECIYIGDEIRDATAAREVGMSFGAVAWGYTTMDALQAHAPAERFAKVPEIARTLLTK